MRMTGSGDSPLRRNATFVPVGQKATMWEALAGYALVAAKSYGYGALERTGRALLGFSVEFRRRQADSGFGAQGPPAIANRMTLR
jgi:hypothetical protein